MNILVASDKWKGSLDAPSACAAMARGLSAVFPTAAIQCMPIADGGEGLVEAVAGAVPGSRLNIERVAGPLGGGVDAHYASLPDGTAVIEMASAAGWHLVRDRPADPWQANTIGVGELMRAAVRGGARRLIVGLGGSATNDAGGGMAQALGWSFPGVGRWPADWRHLTTVAAPERPLGVEVFAACDVTNTLTGPNGCTRVFGPQKGITPDQFDEWDRALDRISFLFPAELAVRPGAGAAGGLGWGLTAFCDGRIVSGFNLVAGLIGLEAAVSRADLVITGEGSLDTQTLDGKGPQGVAALARRHRKRVIGIGGRVTSSARALFDLGFAVSPDNLPLPEAMAQAADLIESAVVSHAAQLRQFS